MPVFLDPVIAAKPGFAFGLFPMANAMVKATSGAG